MDSQFLLDRITATRAQIVAYEAAALALADGIQSYTIDTGQGRQVVTRADVRSINITLDQLYNREATLSARLGSGSVNVSPGW